MLFVSKKKYKELDFKYQMLRKENVAQRYTITQQEMEINDSNTIIENYKKEAAVAKKSEEENRNRSAAAVNREKWKRAKRIKDLEFRISQLEKDNSTLTKLNEKYLNRGKELKNELDQATDLIQKLTTELDKQKKKNSRKKPTVEDLKWETHQCDRDKLKGTSKSKTKGKDAK